MEEAACLDLRERRRSVARLWGLAWRCESTAEITSRGVIAMSATKKRKISDENEFYREVRDFNGTIGKELFTKGGDEERSEKMVRINVVGGFLSKKFAWAVPDSRALKIIGTFGPIIELGCGNAYWASLLREMGCDIIAVDKYSKENEDGPFIKDIIKGDARILNKKQSAGRTLLLCYPDDRESLSLECLKYYQGDTLIHIGELAFTTGTLAGGADQCPFGRTTCSEFQVELAAQFHCVLSAKLKMSLPHCKDYISVWRRSSFVSMGEGEGECDEGEEEEEEEDLWRAIPAEEELPDLDVAAPAYKHLL